MMKKLFAILLILLLFAVSAWAEEGILALMPADMTILDGLDPIALYCGPTQGFYRHEEQVIDLAQPFVCFGQYDCWTMVAQGTSDAFGPVGFIEGGLFSVEALPELSFEDAFPAMIEEDAPVTNAPLSSDSAWDIVLPRGTQVTVLAAFGDFLYVQTELDSVPARVFVAAAAL